MTDSAKIAFLTGVPTSFLARRVLAGLLERSPAAQVRCLVQPSHLDEARELLRTMAADQRERVSFLEGDTASIDLGLSGKEFLALRDEVEVIHHCAAVTYLGAAREQAERANIRGACEILELVDGAPKLEHIVHWSSASVSGARRGFVLESELDDSAGFHNVIEETRFEAEQILSAVRDELPITILRPAIVVGDSKTGETARLDGPYLLIRLMLNAPLDWTLPLPDRGDTPLNLVPIDYVVDAGLHLAADPRSIGGTYHLVDPDPLTARRVFELIARATGRSAPRFAVPLSLLAGILRAPGLDRIAPMQAPRAFLEQLGTEVVYDDRGARELLAGSGLFCPPFENYVDAMVRFVEAHDAVSSRHDSIQPESEGSEAAGSMKGHRASSSPVTDGSTKEF